MQPEGQIMADGERQLRWPSGEDITAVLDLQEAARRCAGELDEAGILRRLRDLPEPQLRATVTHIGMRSISRPTAAIARRLREQLEHTGDLGVLHAVLCPVAASTLRAADSAGDRDWELFLAGKRDDLRIESFGAGDLCVQDAIENVLDYLGPTFEKLLLLEAIKCGHNPAVAFTLLAAVDEEAAAAHQTLREDFPDLPLPRLGLFGYASSQVPATADPDGSDASPPTSHDQTDPDQPNGAHEMSWADIAAEVEQLDWDRASRAATEAAEALANRQAPEVDSVHFLNEFTTRAHQLAAEISELAGERVVPAEDDMTSSIMAATELDEEEALVSSLTGLAGSEHLEDSLVLVRRLATSEVNEPEWSGLVALARLASAGADRRAGSDVDLSRFSEWEQRVRASLPTTVHQLTMFAALGDLTVNETAPADADSAPKTARGRGNDAVSEVEEKTEAEEPAPAATDAIATPIPEPTPEPEPKPEPDIDDANDSDRPDQLVDIDDSGDTASQGSSATDVADGDTGQGQGAEADGTPARTETTDVPDVDVEALRESLRAQLTKPAETTPEPAPATPAATGQEEAEDTGEAEDDALASAAAEAEALLVSQSRFGLAATLHTDTARHGARTMAAYATHLIAPAGALAAAFAAAAADLNRERLADDRAGQLLAWGAAARVAIVAPPTGAAAVLTNLAPCVADYPALTAVGSAFTDAALAGAFIAPEALEALSSVKEADTLAREASERAAELVATSPSRKIKYTPANGVYQSWMEPDGPLGELLRLAADGNADDAAEVLAKVTSLRGTASRSIDDTWAQRRHQKKMKIVGGARSTLVGLFDEALDVAASWAQNAHHSTQRRSHWGDHDRAAKPLDKLRTELSQYRDQALDELEAMRSAEDTDPQEAAAAQAVFGMLTAAFAISDGKPPTGREPTPAYAVYRELLATDLNLDAVTLEPIGAGVDDLARTIIDLAAAPADSPANVYERRAAQGRHDLTGVLVENLAALAAPGTDELLVQRDSELRKATADLTAALNDLENKIGVHQREATVPDDVAGTLFAQVEQLRAAPQLNFVRAETTMRDIENRLTEHQEKQVAVARATIDAEAGTNVAVAGHRDLLDKLVDKGEVAGALEYLEQLVTHGKLPDPRVEDKHFERFFPRIPDLASRQPDLLKKLREAYDQGEHHPSVSALFDIAATSPDAVPESARKAASKAIGAWEVAGRGRENVVSVLRPILALAGFEFTGATVQPGGGPSTGRQWIRLTGVSGIGYALSPALGSQMSVGGKSLRVLVASSAITPATLADWLRGERQDDTVVVLHLARSFNADERRALANMSRGRPRPVAVVIDPAVMAYLAVQPQPSRATLAAVTLPFTADVPYQPRAGRTSPEMFYGRSRERSDVANLDGASFVSGGRQLGKSALLWSAKDEFESAAPSHHAAVLLEIRSVGSQGDPEQVWPRLLSALHDADVLDPSQVSADGPGVTTAIRSWLDADLDRRLLVLLDEADMFLEADAAGNRFENISLCKTLMESTHRRVKFVFAGLHRTVRFESLPNQPLSHLGPPVIVGPLSPQPAYSLLTEPLSVLGYRFFDPQVQPARILAFTNNVPSLLQLFGQALVRRLNSRELVDGPPSAITDDDISEVLDDTNLQEQIRAKYLLTLDLDDRYKVIVYTVAHNALTNGVDTGMTLAELEEQCQFSWPEGFADVNIDHLRGLVAECCDLGVLAHDQGRYRMRTQTMLRLLGTTETIEEVLTNPSRLQLPASTDAEHHRAALGHPTNRSPLTSRQVAQVLGDTGRCFMVAGSEALGVQWLPSALEHLHHEGATRGRAVARCQNLTEAGIRAKLARVSESTVLIADMRGADSDKVLAAYRTASEELARTGVPATVVIASDPPGVLAWRAVDHLIEVGRVSRAGLRLWCEESDTPFLAAAAQERLAEVTGGWPKLVAAAMTEANKSALGPDHALAKVSAQVSDPVKATAFVVEAGLLPASGVPGRDEADTTSIVRAALLAVADLTGTGPGEKVDELVDVLAVAQTPDGLDLTEEAGKAGFADIEQVLLALRALGALAVDPEGRIRPEPVLLTALQAALAKAGGR